MGEFSVPVGLLYFIFYYIRFLLISLSVFAYR